MKAMRRISLFWLPHFVVLAWAFLLVSVHSDEDLSQFMYLSQPPEDVYPVQEYKASTPDEKPAFLFDPEYPYPRVVEFYAHWCPHCKKFKPKYIELARRLKEITDHLPEGTSVEVHAVSCVPNKDICKGMGIHGYPSVGLFQAHSINMTDIGQAGTHPKKILSAVGINIDNYDSLEGLAGNVAQSSKAKILGSASEQQVQNQHFKARSKKETFDDAHLSFDFVLRNGVFTSQGPLPLAQNKALSEFLKALAKGLPESSSIYPVVDALRRNYNSIVQSEESLIGVLDNQGRPPSQSWSSTCSQHGTGYTCGLWTLFHILTVGIVEWNRLSGSPGQRMTPMQVADAIRNFVEHFFQCEECRMHFLSEYDACGHDRCNRLVSSKEESTFDHSKQLPLWLYETHNGVNTRLRQERLDNNEEEDTTSPWQVQWPPVYQCPACWLSQGRWDEDQVYRFLRLQYWPEDYRSSEIRNNLQYSSMDLSPDVSSAVRKHVVPADETYVDAPYSPLPLVTVVLLSVVPVYLWHRKRKFDQKGLHKKRESFSDC